MLSPKDNAEIIKLLSTGGYTLQQVGDRYRVSRERIRQIYKEATGKGVAPLRKQRTLAKREAWLNEIVFICRGCMFPVKRRDRRSSQNKFCSRCRYILVVEQRDPTLRCPCMWCGKEFHPFRSSKYGYAYFKNKNLFCKLEHYWDWYRCNKEMQD